LKKLFLKEVYLDFVVFLNLYFQNGICRLQKAKKERK